MIQIPVTIRSADADVPSLETVGFAPHADSPLAVTQDAVWQRGANAWVRSERFRITHRPTGFALGERGVSRHWPTIGTAFVVLQACEPDFPAWPLAMGGDGAADVACRYKFRAALGELGAA